MESDGLELDRNVFFQIRWGHHQIASRQNQPVKIRKSILSSSELHSEAKIFFLFVTILFGPAHQLTEDHNKAIITVITLALCV